MKSLLIASVLALGLSVSAQAKDIVDTAVGAGNFKTLAAALTAAGLIDTLKGKGPFTVFAPTDEAFAKIPKADLDALLKDKAKLTAVLTYHVVPGKVMAKDVKAGKVKTVQGSELTISTTAGVKVDNATVVKTDIGADNGVIHVIDSVILPADKDIVDTAVAAVSFNTLVAAVQAAGLVDVLKGEGGAATALVVAQSVDGDYSFLDMQQPAFDLTDRGVTGRAPSAAVDAFVYAERGVYRRGETVHATVLLRDDKANAITGLPLTFLVERPDGVTYLTATLDDKGAVGFSRSFQIAQGAQGGTWRIKAFTDPARFKADVDVVWDQMKSSPRLPGVSDIRLPGERLARVEAERRKSGIPVPAALRAALDDLAGSLGVDPL